MKKLLLAFIFVPTLLFSQSKKERKALEAQQKADQLVISNLKSHLQNLRSAQATNANKTEYITTQFKSIGLQPKGTNGFVQPFVVNDGKAIGRTTYLKINDELLEINKEYFPLCWSAEKKATGMPAMALRERGVPWFTDLKDWLEDGTRANGYNLEEALKKEVVKVAAKGATALFIYNSGAVADGLYFNGKDKSLASPIPVIYITSAGYTKYLSDHSAMLDIELNVGFEEKTIHGNNVVGYIDNAAPSTVILGADYNPASTDTSSILNENAASTAMLIELGKMLIASKAKNNNYLFICLGGADKGFTAANYWIENTTTNQPTNYLLHLNTSGSYQDNKKLSVEGSNSSPVWNEVFAAVTDKKLEVNIDTINATPTLFTSFKSKGIPVLIFSTANQISDINSPGGENKINYQDEVQIAKLIVRLIEATDSKGRIETEKVAQQEAPAIKAIGQTEPIVASATAVTATKSNTSVSLGIIPDKTTIEAGLKIAGVTPKKLASKLGLLPGDVLTSLGSYTIYDFKSYLQALSHFKPGDKTVLKIKRGKDDKEFSVAF